ncbi:MAG: thiamine diphosphokinase [Eubacteriales bacterium]|nr:thiamine diphosphokinase [Eubacteriales bacterium]
MSKKKFLLVCGSTVDIDILTAEAARADVLMAVDSGLDKLQEAALVPDILIGDMDSTRENTELLPEDVRILRFEPEKDDTDTALAIGQAIEEGADEITVLGATGGRLDHFLGNIEALRIALDAGVPCVMMDRCNRIRLIDMPCLIPKRSRYISLLPYTDTVRNVRLRGFKYSLDCEDLHRGKTVGISNEIVAHKGYIAFTSGILTLIESDDDGRV